MIQNRLITAAVVFLSSVLLLSSCAGTEEAQFNANSGLPVVSKGCRPYDAAGIWYCKSFSSGVLCGRPYISSLPVYDKDGTRLSLMFHPTSQPGVSGLTMTTNSKASMMLHEASMVVLPKEGDSYAFPVKVYEGFLVAKAAESVSTFAKTLMSTRDTVTVVVDYHENLRFYYELPCEGFEEVLASYNLQMDIAGKK